MNNFFFLNTRSEKNIPSLNQWIKLNLVNNNSWRNCSVPNKQIHRERTVIMQASKGCFFLGYSQMQFCWRDGMLFHLIFFSTNNYEGMDWCPQKALTVHLGPLSTTPCTSVSRYMIVFHFTSYFSWPFWTWLNWKLKVWGSWHKYHPKNVCDWLCPEVQHFLMNAND